MIAAIDTVDGSTLGVNLVTSHQVDCMSSAFIPAEGVENDQEHFTSCSNKLGRFLVYQTISLVANSLCKESIIVSECSNLLKLWV